jgi:hypothetical protein
MARWGHSDRDYLFWDRDFHDVAAARRAQLKQAIDDASPIEMRATSPTELAASFAERFQLVAPELTEGATSATVDETQVDVSRDPHLSFMYGSFGRGPHNVAGIKATYYVPFVGDRNMLKVKPNTYTTVIPAAEISGSELRFHFIRPGEDVAGTKAAFDEELKRVKQYLGWLTDNVRTFNHELGPLAKEIVVNRLQRLEHLDQGTTSLGIPIRRAPRPADSPLVGQPQGGATPGVKPPERFDVALSFAGENRDYVEQVATGLKAAAVSVFYDGFETAQLWGKNLVDHLAEIYQNRSRYVVMFISEHYAKKAWPRHERQHAQARALVAQDEYILPARFDDTEVPGMTNTVSYVDLRGMSPSALVEVILEKLGRQ